MRLTCYRLTPYAPNIVPAAPTREWMDRFQHRYAYRCLPLDIANSYGWDILCPFHLKVTWTGGMEQKDIIIEALDGYPYVDHFAASNFTRGIVTFHTGYLFRTEPGWDILATGPLNNPKHGVVPLSGVIETDWLPYPFTMNWHMTEPGSIEFKEGEPFCTIIPVPHEKIEEFEPVIVPIESDPELMQQYETWKNQRHAFIAHRDKQPLEKMKNMWERHYFQGKVPEKEGQVEHHKTKLKLKAPVEKHSV